jgi:hypothetical protein
VYYASKVRNFQVKACPTLINKHYDVKKKKKLCVVTHAFNPSSREDEAE